MYSCMNKELITGGVVLFTFVCSMNYLINEFFGPNSNNTEIQKVEQKQEIEDISMTEINQIEMVEQTKTEIVQTDNVNDHNDKNDHIQKEDFSTILENVLKPMIDIIECNVNNELLPIEKIIDRKHHLLHLNQRLTLIKEHLQQIKEEIIN